MRKSMKVAYLEDSPDQGRAVMQWLQAESIDCEVYPSFEAMQVALESAKYDAVILDVEIQGQPLGLSMLEYIRSTVDAVIPVLIVSSKPYWDEALQLGADDFLEKPLNPKQLSARVFQLLRPISDTGAVEYYPPYQLHSAENLITNEGRRVELTTGEFELAATLFKHFGKVLSYDWLISTLPEQSSETSSRRIQSDLQKLKRKIGLNLSESWRLETVYQHGCRLVDTGYHPNRS